MFLQILEWGGVWNQVIPAAWSSCKPEPFWIGSSLLQLQNGGAKMLSDYSVLYRNLFRAEMREWIAHEHFPDLHRPADV